MNQEIEQKFVKTFIEKNKQDRFLHELFSKEKRKNIWPKISHNAHLCLKTKYIILESEKLDSVLLEKEIKRLSVETRQCYLLSEKYDGILTSLKEALNCAFEDYGAAILIINEVTAIIKEESEKGATKKYLLYKKDY